ncbi:MAG TPA: TIGR02530 family flagellar biosynthesis protein [Solirubrobacteraceae bacterium]|jgi:flagellar operon protein|nr:TIGR02530 family flagellar biosynthesis protein [Solirubrobacteraceae bacterium]
MSAITNPALLPPGAAAPAATPASTPAARGAGSGSAPAQPFADVLKGVQADSEAANEATQLRFSRHALQRVERRGVALDASTLGRLNEGVGRAASKGSRASVVLVDDTAFVVSVTNKTVLTAVPQEHMKEQVFTNIDSAVIA